MCRRGMAWRKLGSLLRITRRWKGRRATRVWRWYCGGGVVVETRTRGGVVRVCLLSGKMQEFMLERVHWWETLGIVMVGSGCLRAAEGLMRLLRSRLLSRLHTVEQLQRRSDLRASLLLGWYRSFPSRFSVPRSRGLHIPIHRVHRVSGSDPAACSFWFLPINLDLLAPTTHIRGDVDSGRLPHGTNVSANEDAREATTLQLRDGQAACASRGQVGCLAAESIHA